MRNAPSCLPYVAARKRTGEPANIRCSCRNLLRDENTPCNIALETAIHARGVKLEILQGKIIHYSSQERQRGCRPRPMRPPCFELQRVARRARMLPPPAPFRLAPWLCSRMPQHRKRRQLDPTCRSCQGWSIGWKNTWRAKWPPGKSGNELMCAIEVRSQYCMINGLALCLLAQILPA